MLACKDCKYYDNFTRLRLYCRDCIEKLNDRACLRSRASCGKYIIPNRRLLKQKKIKTKDKKVKLPHVNNLPLLQVEFNYLTDLINNSEKDYTNACKKICDRIFTIGIIYNICGPDSERFCIHITDLKKSIIRLCAEILSA